MGIGKSKAVPKALWLALIVVGVMTAYDDIRHQRPGLDNAGYAANKIHAVGLTMPQTLAENAPDQHGPSRRR